MKRMLLALLAATTLSACGNTVLTGFAGLPASVAERNLSYRTDHFEAYRRITIRNAETNAVLWEHYGYCAYWQKREMQVLIVCPTEDGGYVRHWFGPGVIAEIVQLNSMAVSTTQRER